jgi:hypothetical protein
MTFFYFLKVIDLNKDVVKKMRLLNKKISDKEVLFDSSNFVKKNFDFEQYSIKYNDSYNFRILYIFVKKAYLLKKDFKNLGINEKIYFDTFACFARFIKETKVAMNKICFDRYWWTTRQISLKLFRIGELEYEIVDKETINIHIPSDAKLGSRLICKSITEAKVFFKKYFNLDGMIYKCDSWLLSSNLKAVLNKDSRILSFQKLFKVVSFDEKNTDYYFWVFKTYDKNRDEFKSDTELQKNIKEKFKTSFNVGSAEGYLL